MLNDWTIRKTAIVEADDFSDSFSRNGLNFLFYWKSRFPKFKITLFTIPEKTSNSLLVSLFQDGWIEFAVHGFNHESNFECYGWDYDKTKVLMERVLEDPNYTRIFKSPGWSITPGNNGYPAAPEDPINADPQAVYKALRDMNYIILDRHYNKEARPEGCKIVCVDCQTDLVHMHTWSMMTPNPDERNGFEQVETRGVPWSTETNFKFISEAWNEGLILSCK